MKSVDEILTDFLSYVELEHEFCGLNHGPDIPPEKAVNYICQNIGQDQFRVPVCEECIEALADKDWILCYCVSCHSSQWILRTCAKNKYPPGKSIYWLSSCPKCHTT